MTNNDQNDLGENIKDAGRRLRDKANEAAGRVKQGVEDIKDDMDNED